MIIIKNNVLTSTFSHFYLQLTKHRPDFLWLPSRRRRVLSKSGIRQWCNADQRATQHPKSTGLRMQNAWTWTINVIHWSTVGDINIFLYLFIFFLVCGCGWKKNRAISIYIPHNWPELLFFIFKRTAYQTQTYLNEYVHCTRTNNF